MIKSILIISMMITTLVGGLFGATPVQPAAHQQALQNVLFQQQAQQAALLSNNLNLANQDSQETTSKNDSTSQAVGPLIIGVAAILVVLLIQKLKIRKK